MHFSFENGVRSCFFFGCCCNTQDGPHIILMCFIFSLLMTFLSLFIHHLTSHLHGKFVRAIVNDVFHFCRLITDLFHMAQ